MTEQTLPAAEALARLGVRPEQADLTVVQFSTAFCGPCRATRARLRQLQATRPGLVLVEVDAESHLDAVRALGVDRTPTLLYLDRSGRLVGRSSGGISRPPPIQEPRRRVKRMAEFRISGASRA